MDKEALHYLFQQLHGHRRVETDDGITTPLVCVPEKSRIESLEEYQDSPSSIRGKVALGSCDSFCAYVNRFREASSTIYLDVDGGRFRAVLDHSDAGKPRWGRHQATFTPKLSMPWLAWRNLHKKAISQIDLAHFIEERLDDILSPEPNMMLQAALEFESNERLTLASSTNLDNGATRFTFKKDNASRSVDFPHRITLRIPIHECETSAVLEGRVRYKTDGDGALRFTFSFVRDPQMIEREAMLDLAAKIREQTEGLHHYEGSP